MYPFSTMHRSAMKPAAMASASAPFSPSAARRRFAAGILAKASAIAPDGASKQQGLVEVF